MKDGDTTLKVNSRIRVQDQDILFEDPDIWKATRVTNNEMSFENMTAQGMRRIIWLHTRDRHWWAIIQYPRTTHYYDLIQMPELDNAVDRLLKK